MTRQRPARLPATAAAPEWAQGVEPGARIVCAMSGGVDSSVAAALLVERGFQVVGVSMRLASSADGSSGGSGHAAERSSGCCSLADFRDAARVADRLGIAHYVFDMREQFDRSVVSPFVEQYLAGRTPSPCILCNREIKFSLLRRKAVELGAAHVATGHYARRALDAGRYRLLTGLDDAKDQSYFLFEMGQAELAHTLFPVGGMTKADVRSHAERLGLGVAGKPDSQEICFVPDGRYAELVERLAGDRVRAGAIVDESGRELGRHDGVHRFTVGQRKGLGLAAAEPLYVADIDAAAARVTVAPRARLGRAGMELQGVVWTSGSPEPPGTSFDVRIRYRHRGVAATIAEAHRDDDDGGVRVLFAEPQDGVSPGQAAVFYRGDAVIGGGWIRRALGSDQGRPPVLGTEERCG